MMKFWFLFKEGFHGLIRSKYAGAFTILIIWIALIIVGLGFIGARDTLVAVNKIRSQFDIDIFLHKNATEKEIDNFRQYLESRNEVETIDYISEKKAAEIFKQEFGDDIFDVLEYNPLPPSFTISLKENYRNTISVESITANFRKHSVVDEIKYRKQFLFLMEKYQRSIMVVILVLFLFLTIISVMLISHSIKMSIFARRDIIDTMKLIGATDNFIRVPFMIEGLLEGLIASILSSCFIYFIAMAQNNYFQTVFNYHIILGLNFYFTMIILGSGMGFLGSLKAIKKFL
jgi:cell division transport system permease protein